MNVWARLRRLTVRARDERGLSAIEGLVSLTLLTLSITGTASLLGVSAVHDATSLQATDAVTILQTQMDALRDLRYDEIPTGTTTTMHTAGGTTYTIVRTVTAGDPAPNMKRIRAVASWNQQGPKSYVVETIFTNLK